MSDNMQAEVLAQAQAVKDRAAEIFEIIDGEAIEDCAVCKGTGLDAQGDDECTECDGEGTVEVTEIDGEDPNDVLNEWPLEIVWEKGEPFTVVFGTGGPHTELTGGGRMSGTGFKVTSYWGGDQASVSGAAVNRLGEHFRSMVDDGE